MFESDVDYLKFLHNPRKYIDSQLEYIEDEYEVNLKTRYPVCKCDDIFCILIIIFLLKKQIDAGKEENQELIGIIFLWQ